MLPLVNAKFCNLCKTQQMKDERSIIVGPKLKLGVLSDMKTTEIKMFDVGGDANGYRNTQEEHLQTIMGMRMAAIYNDT